MRIDMEHGWWAAVVGFVSMMLYAVNLGRRIGTLETEIKHARDDLRYIRGRLDGHIAKAGENND